MKKMIYLILTVMVSMFISCDDSGVVEPLLIQDPAPVNKDLVDGIYDGGTAGDPFRILSLKIENDKLMLEVSYSGGCEEHDFSLVWNGECDGFDASKKTQFVIVHDANGDLCEAANITKNLVFDYNAIMAGQTSVEGCGAMYFANASNSETFRIPVGMEKIVQGRYCILEVELVEAMCASGFLGNLWFKSSDPTLYPDEDFFYFQPTNIAVDAVFEKGNYLIGVRIVDSYDGEEAVCLAYPGPSVPAEILCIEKVD